MLTLKSEKFQTSAPAPKEEHPCNWQGSRNQVYEGRKGA